VKNILNFFAVVSFAIFPFFANAQTYWQSNGNNIYNTNTGYVGIGTTTPTSKLQIVNTGGAGTDFLISNSNLSPANSIGTYFVADLR
jgi:hypothetical protein